MKTRPFVIATITALTLIPTACSDNGEPAADASSISSSTTTNTTPTSAAKSDLTAFCAAGARIETATSTIDSPESAVTVFTGLQSTIEEMVSAAPDDLAEDAKAFSGHIDHALSADDFAAFEDGTVDALVAKFDAACAETH